MDKGMTTKIIAVVVVIIIVAAAAVVLLNNDKSEDNSTPGTVEVGAIYGNVNSDYYIDQTDLDIIQDIIDGNKTLEEWPLADADMDGDVDADDLEIVRKAMNKETTTLYVMSYVDDDSPGEAVAVSYPLTKSAALSQVSLRSIIAVLGLYDKITASGTNNTISSVLDKGLYDGVENGSIIELSSNSLTTDDVSTLVTNGVKFVLAEETGMASSSEIVQLLTGYGISYVMLNFINVEWQIKSVRTLGILYDCEETAEEYNTWTQNIIDTIVGNEGDQYGTATVLAVVMTNSVCGTSSDYYAMTILAGGNNLADWSSSTQKFNTGDTWLLESKYNADYIIHFRSIVFETGITDSAAAKYSGYFSSTTTYQEGGYYLINGVLPLPVRLAVMAETMYPDCFDEGWSAELFQYYFSHFLGQSDVDVTEYSYLYHATA